MGVSFILFNHIIPLDTDPLKGGNQSSGQKHKLLKELAKDASVVYSVGPLLFRHFDTEYREMKILHEQFTPQLNPDFMAASGRLHPPKAHTQLHCFQICGLS